MKANKAVDQLVRRELADLSIPEGCPAYEIIYSNAVEAAEIMSKRGLIRYIEEYAATLGNYLFITYD